MNKILIALCFVLLVGCTNVSVKNGLQKTEEILNEAETNDAVNNKAGNIVETIKNQEIVKTITTTNEVLETPERVIGRIIDDTDVESFGDII